MKAIAFPSLLVSEWALSAPGSYSGNVSDLSDGVSAGSGGLWVIAAFVGAGYAVALLVKAAGIGGWGDADWSQVGGMGLVCAIALFILAQILMFSIVMWPIGIIVAWFAYGRWKSSRKG